MQIDFVVRDNDWVFIIGNLSTQRKGRRPNPHDRRFERKTRRRCIELRIKTVRPGRVMAVTQTATVIRHSAAITSCQPIEANIGSEIVEVSIKRSLRIVVVHFAIPKGCVSHRKIKNAGMTTGLARRRLRKVAAAGPVDLKVDDGMLYQKFSQCDFAMKYRVDL